MGYSTRVSNELGAGNPQAARLAVVASMFLTVSESVIIGSTVFASRSVFGYIFSNEKEVVDYVTSISPLICLSVIADSLHGVLSGQFYFFHNIVSASSMYVVIKFLAAQSVRSLVLLFKFRYCKGMWLAGLGNVCQHRSLLSCWDSGCCHTEFLVRLQRKRPLDRNTSRFFSANSSLLCHNKLRELGRKGRPSPLFIDYSFTPFQRNKLRKQAILESEDGRSARYKCQMV